MDWGWPGPGRSDLGSEFQHWGMLTAGLEGSELWGLPTGSWLDSVQCILRLLSEGCFP